MIPQDMTCFLCEHLKLYVTLIVTHILLQVGFIFCVSSVCYSYFLLILHAHIRPMLRELLVALVIPPLHGSVKIHSQSESGVGEGRHNPLFSFFAKKHFQFQLKLVLVLLVITFLFVLPYPSTTPQQGNTFNKNTNRELYTDKTEAT